MQNKLLLREPIIYWSVTIFVFILIPAADFFSTRVIECDFGWKVRRSTKSGSTVDQFGGEGKCVEYEHLIEVNNSKMNKHLIVIKSAESLCKRIAIIFTDNKNSHRLVGWKWTEQHEWNEYRHCLLDSKQISWKFSKYLANKSR